MSNERSFKFYFEKFEGFRYLLNKYIEASKYISDGFNAQAIPEFRALERAKFNIELSIDEAKEILEKERFWQKEENRKNYPGFKWF